jgi:hypothetical protein
MTVAIRLRAISLSTASFLHRPSNWTTNSFTRLPLGAPLSPDQKAGSSSTARSNPPNCSFFVPRAYVDNGPRVVRRLVWEDEAKDGDRGGAQRQHQRRGAALPATDVPSGSEPSPGGGAAMVRAPAVRDACEATITTSVSNAVRDEVIFRNGRPRPEESACPAGREVLPPLSGLRSLYAGAPAGREVGDAPDPLGDPVEHDARARNSEEGCRACCNGQLHLRRLWLTSG